MKTASKIMLAFLLINVSTLYAQELRVDTLALKDIDNTIKSEKARIVRTDTIEKSSRLVMITGFDVNNRIVLIESNYTLSTKLKMSTNQIQLFDTFGNLILDIQSANGVPVSQHMFVYNKQSRLALEKLLIDGVEVKKIEYQYDENGKLSKKREYLNGVILNKKSEKKDE
jgi:hypothetical protein